MELHLLIIRKPLTLFDITVSLIDFPLESVSQNPRRLKGSIKTSTLNITDKVCASTYPMCETTRGLFQKAA